MPNNQIQRYFSRQIRADLLVLDVTTLSAEVRKMGHEIAEFDNMKNGATRAKSLPA